MTARIAILTRDPADEAYRSHWRDVLDRNAAPLRAAGMTVSGRSWTDAADLAEFDLLLPLLAWGYVREYEKWLGRLAEWDAGSVRFRNPVPVLAWNADKSYLGRLAELGAPVAPPAMLTA